MNQEILIAETESRVQSLENTLGKLIDSMVSLLNTNSSLLNTLRLEVVIKHKYEPENLNALLKQGHDTVWDLANQYTNLESQINSVTSNIADGKEYIADLKAE